ncbi:MAG: MFS transporter [Candidatus Nanopelagicales bacterium]|uniref:MFS transporter n=1 Tax=Actinobacteria bacterium BACL2 MAG-120813-bin23 TaxID=1655569 RepID=A0A0R2Q457_9ACTN|nr:MAG: MFS transporter [Actinobacteria bacterium BACL2 MAG-120813-bin23]MDP4614747.1 MFS transporter [Candidatus Nanopelagicales bacterium]MDP4863896.1 MFS transporter [Candidatus Nanopelagicaceae bacterium]HAG53768.1 MFS transporter [Actinomycetota bacterium]MDP4652743.1 MFS transporter [Candidatus Nanopelagicales bacterium]
MSSNSALQEKTVKVLATAQVLNGVGVAGTVAAGSLLVASITNSETLAGLAQTSSVLGAAALALPLARLTSRGGRRLALSVGLIAGVIGSLLAIFGGSRENIYLMLTGTFLVGAASAAGYQARFAAIDLATDEKRAKQLSFVVWGSTIGAVSGPNLMEPSGNLAESLGLPRLTGPYLISAVTLALAVLVIQLFLRPDPYLTAAKDSGAANLPRVKTKVALKHIRSNARASFAIAAIAIGHIAMVAVMVMTPVHMAHVDVTLTIIGLVISVHVLGMYAFSPLVGALTDRLGRLRVIQIGVAILLSSALISGFARADDAITLGIGLFLLGLGWSCTLIAGSALLTESVSPEFKSASQGASDLVMNLSGASGGAVAGVVIATLSYGWLCLLSALPVAFLGLWSLKIKAR